jgi:phospholipid transport system transporter-binding protein
MARTASSPKTAKTDPNLVLEADLRLAAAPALRERLLAALAAGEPVQLDGGAVTQVDTATLQLLCAFVRDAAAKSLAVTWTAVSDALRAGSLLLGLDKTINLPAA